LDLFAIKGRELCFWKFIRLIFYLDLFVIKGRELCLMWHFGLFSISNNSLVNNFSKSQRCGSHFFFYRLLCCEYGMMSVKMIIFLISHWKLSHVTNFLSIVFFIIFVRDWFKFYFDSIWKIFVFSIHFFYAHLCISV